MLVIPNLTLAQLNAALPLLQAPVERQRLATLNTRAGLHALQAAAYPAALHHLQLAQQLLPATATAAARWPVLLGLCQAAGLGRQWALADSLYPQLDALADNRHQRIEGFRLRIQQYLRQGRYYEALQLQREGLALLGIQNPGAVLPGRLMALVLSMPARQLGYPVAVFILMPSE